MTTKKFSMASAIAIGLVSISMTSAFAACPCEKPQRDACSNDYVGCENNITKSDMHCTPN